MKRILCQPINHKTNPNHVAFTPKGGCPLKLATAQLRLLRRIGCVAFTPKGGCPLKQARAVESRRRESRCVCSIHPQGWVPVETGTGELPLFPVPARGCSIHPQGWVPVETWVCGVGTRRRVLRSIHPQGWVPVETQSPCRSSVSSDGVAFTPKGGCPLKLSRSPSTPRSRTGSIHPQGWVPVETSFDDLHARSRKTPVAFTPKGGCPLKPYSINLLRNTAMTVAFTPKGGCPLKRVL